MRFLITFITLFLFVVFFGLASSCVEERPADPIPQGCWYGEPLHCEVVLLWKPISYPHTPCYYCIEEMRKTRERAMFKVHSEPKLLVYRNSLGPIDPQSEDYHNPVKAVNALIGK